MKLQVKTQEIELIPSVCKELEGEFVLTFRQPTQYDVVAMGTLKTPSDIIDYMVDLSTGIKGDIELEDETGKVQKCTKLKDLLQYNNPVITSVMSDIVTEFNRIQKNVFDIEKKS